MIKKENTVRKVISLGYGTVGMASSPQSSGDEGLSGERWPLAAPLVSNSRGFESR
jgi:hypothetical protein